MKPLVFTTHLIVAFAIAVTARSSLFAQATEATDEVNETTSFTSPDLPQFEAMLAIGLKHNPEVRAAQAALDRVRLQVTTDIRAFREQWRAAQEVQAEFESANREFDRISQLGEGVIPSRKVLEVKHALELARTRAASAEARLNELNVLLPHLLGAAIHGSSRAPGDSHPNGVHDHEPDVVSGPAEEKLRERLQLLMEIASLQQAAYTNGEVAFDDVVSAQRELLLSQLELAGSTDERVRIRQRVVEMSRQIEEVTKRLVEEMELPRPELLKATAFRLRAEADLILEQQTSGH